MIAPAVLPFIANRIDVPIDPVIIGQLGAPHGIQGWIKIHSYTDSPDNLFTYHPWLCQWQQGWYVITCDKWRAQGKSFVGHIEGCDDRNMAGLCTHLNLYIPRAQLPKLSDNEYYWHDLEGLQVINQEGVMLGTIDYLFNNGASDVMVIRGDKERLIPYVLDDIIVRVDIANRCLYVNWDAEF